MQPDPTTTMIIRCIAADYGGTLTGPAHDEIIGMKPVDELAAVTVRTLHARGLRLVLASNTLPGQDRRPALEAAGIADLFSEVLQSDRLGFAKPAREFYAAVVQAARCAAGQILFVGNNLRHDVAGPLEHGMQAVLIRPHGLATGEELPDGARLVTHFSGLLPLLGEEP
ncbi:hypothetical protein DPM19_12125 [Actinomadura craniellae]|uniref:HAD family hydrolase n=1 Tax=Actinomadura craniellae TaxID=2231787 RepID=A0A365H8N1_9ACTN|nr:HAD family hydrolase [Actinomadura craniellae]RAY15431.1 hypothetical protein DPM19_12125 [Actinomadura craniellae]